MTAITLAQAAKRLGVKPATLHNWRRSKTDPLPHRLYQSSQSPIPRVIMDDSEVTNWLARQRPEYLNRWNKSLNAEH